LLILAGCWLFVSTSVWGQTEEDKPLLNGSPSGAEWVNGKFRETEFAPEFIVAQWKNQIVQAGDIDFHLDRTVQKESLEGETLQRARAEALSFLVDRRWIMDQLIQEKTWPALSKIAAAEEVQIAELEVLGISLEQFLADKKISHSFWRTEIAWGIGWPEYINRTWNDESLEAFFAEHRRDFDGTRIKVGQILFEVKSDEDRERVLTLAAETRDEIEAGRQTFETAVLQHSIAPSKNQAGELGWIERNQPMPEDFSRRVFEMQPGDLADPFVSEFGVHLVKCLDLEPGKKMLGDVRPEVLQAAARQEFARLRLALPTNRDITVHPEFPHWESPKR
jgi:parvulin-like peptidyl-prolyl isomerase